VFLVAFLLHVNFNVIKALEWGVQKQGPTGYLLFSIEISSGKDQ